MRLTVAIIAELHDAPLHSYFPLECGTIAEDPPKGVSSAVFSREPAR